jgi:soluble lytic murein transglycosylase-like protein
MDPNLDAPALIKSVAVEVGVDPHLFLALCIVESALNPFAMRYEPAWRHLWHSREMAEVLLITHETEVVLQSSSFGFCQIMGAVVREQGFRGMLTRLFDDPELCLKFGAIHLRKYMQKYPSTPDAVAAYNFGHVEKTPGGMYANQKYVDRVYSKYRELLNRP